MKPSSWLARASGEEIIQLMRILDALGQSAATGKEVRI